MVRPSRISALTRETERSGGAERGRVTNLFHSLRGLGSTTVLGAHFIGTEYPPSAT